MREFDELDVVFEAENGLHMQQQMQKHRPDVVLIDINMPIMDGYAATAWLKKTYPSIKSLVLSMFDDDHAVIGMIKAGACGYVLKESDPKEVLHAVLTVVDRDFTRMNWCPENCSAPLAICRRHRSFRKTNSSF